MQLRRSGPPCDYELRPPSGTNILHGRHTHIYIYNNICPYDSGDKHEIAPYCFVALASRIGTCGDTSLSVPAPPVSILSLVAEGRGWPGFNQFLDRAFRFLEGDIRDTLARVQGRSVPPKSSAPGPPPPGDNSPPAATEGEGDKVPSPAAEDLQTTPKVPPPLPPPGVQAAKKEPSTEEKSPVRAANPAKRERTAESPARARSSGRRRRSRSRSRHRTRRPGTPS